MLLRAWLVDNGWQQCVSDPCIYVFRAGHVFAMIALYVDDIPAAYNDASWLTSFKAKLGARFKIKDMGELSQLLGMHTTRDRSARTISLDQSKHLRDILAKYGMTTSTPSSLPMDLGFLAGLAHMASPPPFLGWPRTATPTSWVVSCTQPCARAPMSPRHPWLRPGISHGRSSAGPEKNTPIPPWHHRHAQDIGGHGPQSPTHRLCRR
jgi:hypothetical protein